MHLNKNKISVFILSLFVALLSFSDSNAQTPNAIAQWIHSMKAESRENNFQPVTVFENTLTEKRMNAVFGETEILNLQTDALNVLLQDAPATMEFEIPVPGSAAVVLQLAQVNISTEDFAVGTKTNSGNHIFNYTNGVHYRGIIKGDDNSIATISIFNNELVGMISSDEGTFTLGKMDDESDSYIFYNSTKSNYHPVMDCYTDESNYVNTGSQSESRGVACKVVKVYFECDYQMYLDHSSDVTATANYVTSLFNQVSTLYANENIEIQIQQIYVWTVTDPYVSYSTASALLPVFSSNNSPFTNGNLAHFLSTRSLGGGVAYLSGLCSSYSCFAVSMVYNSFSNVPTYSWSVEVVTHEMGHNLSSPHTHNCSWAGGPIDNCGPTAGYPTEGGCADGPTPTNGGTIMSYCHLVSGVGINFNNGFGPLPGNLIRNYVTNASCVSQTGIVPSGLAASNISNETATVTWNAVSGTSTYTVQYKKSTETNWTTAGTTSATTFNLVGLSHPVIYNWKVKTDCSNYSTASNFTTINVAACAKPTNLLATNITASSATISWSSVAAAANYTLQYKLSVTAAWTVVYNLTATSYNLTGLGASCTYQWKVKANCSGYTTVQHFSTVTVVCSVPTNAVANYVGGTTAYLTWTGVAGATYYSVYYKTAAAASYTLWGNTLYPSAYMQGLTTSTTYNWRVKSNCSSYTAKKTFTTTADTGQGGTLHDFAAMSWQIAPNPATDFVNVNWNDESKSVMEIELTDITGRILLHQLAENNFAKISTASLANGIYFISLRNADGYIRTGRFIKE